MVFRRAREPLELEPAIDHEIKTTFLHEIDLLDTVLVFQITLRRILTHDVQHRSAPTEE